MRIAWPEYLDGDPGSSQRHTELNNVDFIAFVWQAVFHKFVSNLPQNPNFLHR